MTFFFGFKEENFVNMRQIWLGFDSQFARTTKTADHERTEKEHRENKQTCLFKIQQTSHGKGKHELTLLLS